MALATTRPNLLRVDVLPVSRRVHSLTQSRQSGLSLRRKCICSRAFHASARAVSSNRILVVGAGPAGCTTAYFLARAGFDVHVVERSTRPFYGQGIDITNQAVEVVKRMGLLDQIKANTTGETGFELLDDHGQRVGSLLGTNTAQYASDGNRDGLISPTNEIEIMRGTLNEMIRDAAEQSSVTFRYGSTITAIDQDANSIRVTASDDNKSEAYTAVIGADGAGSQVRRLLFSPEAFKQSLRPTNTFTAYFSMALNKEDQTSYSRLQHGGRGRALWLRPIDRAGTRASAYFITTTPTSTELEQCRDELCTREQQQAKLAALHADMKGIKGLVVRGMHECHDWHFTRLTQIHLPTWHVNRCALVGDAAWCPTPLTGQGTTMALMGAYILAGEMAADPSDPSSAFLEYKRKFDSYVQAEGKIPFGGRAPNIFIPQSQSGVWVLRQLFRLFSNGYGRGLFNGSGSNEKQEDAFRLPTYVF